MATTATRETLHRVAAHVLGRARFQATGRFGLRTAPGGFATPAYGDGPEVLRVADGVLVRETAGGAAYRAIGGASLRDLAAVAGVALDENFSVGAATPPLGDVDRPLELDPGATEVLAAWLDMGQRILDRVCGALPEGAAPGVLQLWPEHFDLGTQVTVPDGGRANLGASLGDSFSEDPYLYVGPWGDARPGEASYWNAPFGAAVRRRELGPKTTTNRSGDDARSDDPGSFERAFGFFREGLVMLGFELGG